MKIVADNQAENFDAIHSAILKLQIGKNNLSEVKNMPELANKIKDLDNLIDGLDELLVTIDGV